MSGVFVQIKTYRYLHEAELAKSVLESEGIQSFIDNELMSTINWAYTSWFGIGLKVYAENAEKAREILSVEEPRALNPVGAKKKTTMILIIGAVLYLALILLSLIVGSK